MYTSRQRMNNLTVFVIIVKLARKSLNKNCITYNGQKQFKAYDFIVCSPQIYLLLFIYKFTNSYLLYTNITKFPSFFSKPKIVILKNNNFSSIYCGLFADPRCPEILYYSLRFPLSLNGSHSRNILKMILNGESAKL